LVDPVSVQHTEELFEGSEACATAAFSCLSDANGVLVSEKLAPGESVSGASQKITEHDQELAEDDFRTGLTLLGNNCGDFASHSVISFLFHAKANLIKNVRMLGY
jgi:hypothetical protein